MNYYASGGQAHGLKSLAQEVRKYGRNGDTILAHINPQEAGILKALGGSGTINPDTGLPEYFFKAVSRAVAAPFKAVNQVVKAIPVIGPAIDKGLVSLDKAVGSAIPGGWNTLAQTALAFTPLGLPAKVGLAALGGSGAFGPSGKFNFQRALLSGALAYGANQLAQGLEAAGGPGVDATAGDVAAKLGVEGASAAPGSQAAMLAEQAAGMGEAGLRNIAGSASYNALPAAGANTFAYNAAGELVPANIAPQITGAATNLAPTPAPSFLDKIGANEFLAETGDNLAAAGRGIQNLSGFGTGAKTAASAFTGPVTTGGMTALGVGAMGLASLDEQEKALTQQYQQGAVNDAEYNRQMALIADGRRRAEEAIRANPYQFAVGGSVDDEYGYDTATGRSVGNLDRGLFGMGYKEGGNVSKKERQDFIDMINLEAKTAPPAQYVEGVGFVNPPPSVQGRLGANIDAFGGNLRAGASGMAMMGPDGKIMAAPGMMDVGYRRRIGPGDLDIGLQRAIRAMPGRDRDYAVNANYSIGFAEGGTPRFLSGGGDGMSDSIPATINDKQPARLADGEFVVPADVVSHLGNGSSKAGAKRLYSMMDKVRQARTGKKSQAPAVNAKRLMPA